jgi:hypothetical protein
MSDQQYEDMEHLFRRKSYDTWATLGVDLISIGKEVVVAIKKEEDTAKKSSLLLYYKQLTEEINLCRMKMTEYTLPEETEG